MWALRFDGNLKVQKANFSTNKPCFLCNDFLRKGEELVFIIIPSEYRGTHKNLKGNFYCHKDEWIEFSKDCSTYEELAEKLRKLKRPKKKLFTKEDISKMEAFCQAARTQGFTEYIKRPYGAKMKMPKSSAYAEYNVYADQFIVEYNNKMGLFETFLEKETSSIILNKMNEIFGIDEREEVKDALDEAGKMIDNVVKTVNDLMN